VNWPMGELDELRRLRVLQASLPGTMLAETLLADGFDQVWSVLGDVENGFPGLVPDVRSIRVVAREGERMRLVVQGRSGLRAPFEMILRPGWCLMQSRWLVFGMAAVPAGDHTRFGYLAGVRLPGKRFIDPLLTPARRRLARVVLRRFETRFGRAGSQAG
jgi:hypothetical protein